MTAREPEPEDVEDTVIGAAAPPSAPPSAPRSALQSSPDEDTVIKGSTAATGVPKPGDSAIATEWAPPPPVRSYHAIRIGTHEPIPLDVPAFIGRRPSTPRITGGRHPRLVRVPSVSREISSTHLEIRQEGSIVVVTDLGSTNGTVITTPGAPAIKLRQGESVVVAPSSVVDIGDDVRIEILPIPEAAS